MTANQKPDDNVDGQKNPSRSKPTDPPGTLSKPNIPWMREQGELFRRIDQALEDDHLNRDIGAGKRDLIRADLGDISELEAVLPSDLIDAWLGAHSQLCRYAKRLYEERPDLWCRPEENQLPPLPPLTQAAYDAAEAEWPELLRKFPGQAVLYRGSKRLAVAKDPTQLFRAYVKKGYKANELMVFDILPDPPSADIDEIT